MYKIVHSEKELKWFYKNIIPTLKDSESLFLSLSARNKYLTDKEKIEYALGRTEMFSRSIVRTNSWEKFLSTIRKYETNEGSYLTKNGFNIPSKAIVCYSNINPSDCLKAYRDFSKVMNEYFYKLSQCSITGHKIDNIIHRINKQSTLLMNAYQKATGTRHWIDFDFDVDKDFLPYVEKIVEQVEAFSGRAFIVDTKSGFHLLVSKNTEFYSKFNPKTIVDIAMDDVKGFYINKFPLSATLELEKVEIIKNSNNMIPLPGTFQGNYPVTVLNK